VIKSELPKYYRDVGLTSLAVIVTVKVDEAKESMCTTDLWVLLRLTEESIEFDEHNLFLSSEMLGKRLLTNHYPHLFIGPDKSPEVCLNGDQHAQTALRILEFLCDYPPHPIQYQQNRNKHQAPTSHSHHGRASGHPRFLLPRRIVARTMRITSLGFARKRREKKHRHGVVLSIPSSEDDRLLSLYCLAAEHRISTQAVCSLGLLYLPKILERSSRSTELVDFIREYGKDLVYIPKETRNLRKVIRAMHEYLDRAKEDLDMVIN
jgi:hypothetical protein